ncbi:MFS transporter [Microbacterium sp. cx-55]|uniref:MFS transporter n=1 Tax=unclassified Microbacterium TaxID=2609290 RepID=UPI001CBC9060|nr:MULTISPECIES: MFS transporter [unclassified Microbacterium]MBZ4486611.1 MFS transporter [Microbacterium sp. cx-55]MCC4907578.1 MFS transporter [Microbacterium sp. cx-59]UGB36422.1 MFS transporter [Microbacterium sp. cx-55]
MIRPPASRAAFPWLVVVGVLVAALSLRGPIVAPTPVLRDIETDLGIGASTAGLLTTAPVLMFALLTPVAAIVIRRAGAEIALLVTLLGVLVGTAIRALPGFPSMLVGMIVIGAAITIGNVVIPVVIRRDVPPERVGIVTASYAATLNVGSLITSLLTAPLAEVVGWNLALVAWSVLSFAGVAVWGAHLRRERRRAAHPVPIVRSEPRPHRTDLDPETITGPLPIVAPASSSVFLRPASWLLLIAFALQVTIYYALSTWLPTLGADRLGLDSATAGALASIFQGVGVLGSFVVPLLARVAPRIVPTLVISASWLLLTGGMLAAPELTWLWLSFGAIAHSGGFVAIFSALVSVARTDAEATTMSALVQGGGYGIGAFGAPIAGALHEATGGWDVALWGMLGLAVLYAVALTSAMAVAARSKADPSPH